MKVTVKTDKAVAYLEKIRKNLTKERIDAIIQRVSIATLTALIQATPKRYTGQTRKDWRIVKDGDKWSVSNTNKVMLFLEEGTVAHGPVKAKALFLPLNRKAALGGWSRGLKYGVDYIFRKWVAGIHALHIVRNQKVATTAMLVIEMKKAIRKAIETSG